MENLNSLSLKEIIKVNSSLGILGLLINEVKIQIGLNEEF